MVALTSRRMAILGGSTGIGLATAAALAERGAEVTTDAGSLRSFYDEAGPIDDLVVTVTRRGGAGPAADLPGREMVDAFEGKPVAQLQAVASALPTLDERGSVTLVSAGSAQSALPGTALPAAVNGAIEAAVPPLARELAPRRVNAVSPGVIETDSWSPLPEADRAEMFAQSAERAPVGRNGAAEDVAHAIATLIENDFITGVVLPCDGGLRLT